MVFNNKSLLTVGVFLTIAKSTVLVAFCFICILFLYKRTPAALLRFYRPIDPLLAPGWQVQPAVDLWTASLKVTTPAHIPGLAGCHRIPKAYILTGDTSSQRYRYTAVRAAAAGMQPVPHLLRWPQDDSMYTPQLKRLCQNKLGHFAMWDRHVLDADAGDDDWAFFFEDDIAVMPSLTSDDVQRAWQASIKTPMANERGIIELGMCGQGHLSSSEGWEFLVNGNSSRIYQHLSCGSCLTALGMQKKVAGAIFGWLSTANSNLTLDCNASARVELGIPPEAMLDHVYLDSEKMWLCIRGHSNATPGWPLLGSNLSNPEIPKDHHGLYYQDRLSFSSSIDSSNYGNNPRGFVLAEEREKRIVGPLNINKCPRFLCVSSDSGGSHNEIEGFLRAAAISSMLSYDLDIPFLMPSFGGVFSGISEAFRHEGPFLCPSSTYEIKDGWKVYDISMMTAVSYADALNLLNNTLDMGCYTIAKVISPSTFHSVDSFKPIRAVMQNLYQANSDFIKSLRSSLPFLPFKVNVVINCDTLYTKDIITSAIQEIFQSLDKITSVPPPSFWVLSTCTKSVFDDIKDVIIPSASYTFLDDMSPLKLSMFITESDIYVGPEHWSFMFMDGPVVLTRDVDSFSYGKGCFASLDFSMCKEVLSKSFYAWLGRASSYCHSNQVFYSLPFSNDLLPHLSALPVPSYSIGFTVKASKVPRSCLTSNLQFYDYTPSSFELQWQRYADKWANDVCAVLTEPYQKQALNLWLGATIPLSNASTIATSAAVLDIDPTLNVFSKMRFKSREGEIISVGIEPLAGVLRDPRSVCGPTLSLALPENNEIQSHEFLGLDTNYLKRVGDYLALSKPSKRVILFDLGCTRWADKEMPGLRWLHDTYSALGLVFTDIFAWEANPERSKGFFDDMPPEVKATMQFNNRPANSLQGSLDNPLEVLRTVAGQDDYVVFKLDIDTPSAEKPLILEILSNPEFSCLIDELFFEHHSTVSAMSFWWGTEKEKVEGSLRESIALFQSLRKIGILAHSWP